MREIKFRGKRIDNSEWIYGSLIQSFSGRTWIKDNNDKFINPLRIKHGTTITADFRCVEVIPETVGQFTGLKDKGGKEVYEGDVIKTWYVNAKNNSHIETVVFRGGKFMAECKIGETGKIWATITDGTPHFVKDKSVYMTEYEVIDNVHDNPELLEVCK